MVVVIDTAYTAFRKNTRSEERGLTEKLEKVKDPSQVPSSSSNPEALRKVALLAPLLLISSLKVFAVSFLMPYATCCTK